MTKAWLALALVGSALAAACSNTDSGTLGNTRNRGTSTPGTGADTDTPTDGTTPQTGPVATNSPEGKAFYIASVHPILSTACGACHGAAGPGPSWLTSANAEQSYAQLFQSGYVVTSSRLTTKGAHGGMTTNVLTPAQVATFNQWVAMELADGGEEAPPNILAKIGDCFDLTLFDAMKMGDWRPTPRNNNNRPAGMTAQQWNENQDTCTGCRSACFTCHSQGDGNFFDAVGQTALPKDTTFVNTKQTPYISKFFAVTPDGKPMASDSMKLKQDSTMKTGRDTHPLLNMTDAQMAAIKAFTDDAIAKFNAGTCGK